MKLDEPTTPVQLLLGVAFAVLAASAASLLFGHAITPATFGLAAVIAALLGLLRALYRIVSVLGRPDQGLDFVGDEGRSARAWREEKKRALRAIKELDFDYSMRKISESDYEAIRVQYSERALVAMRALDESARLHPALERDLASKDPGFSFHFKNDAF